MTGGSLSAEHEAALHAAGIRPDVIAARGYWTAPQGAENEVRHLGLNPQIVKHGSALMIPLHDVYGGQPFTVARPDVPRLDTKRGKLVKYENPRKAPLPLDVHPLAHPGLLEMETLWITEGVKKADAALSHGASCAIALQGVWGWKGPVAIAAFDRLRLRDRTTMVVFDSDLLTKEEVRTALRRLKAFLGARGAHVLIVHLEPTPWGAKQGLDDALVGGLTLTELAGRATESLRVPAPANDHRPLLNVATPCTRVTQEAFGHLATAGVYRVSDGLAVVTEEAGVPSVRRLEVDTIRPVLDRLVRCVRESEKGAVPCYPPLELARMLVPDMEAPLPRLSAVTTSPTFTADGRLLDQPGYDQRSGILTRFRFTPRLVSTCPSADEVAEARRLWDDELLVDFAFPPESARAHRTSAVALALTPLVRHHIPGPTPLIDISGTTAGAGKGLLKDACLSPTQGRIAVPGLALPADDDELRKLITTGLREQRAVFMFDNVVGDVRSPVLAKALTDERWGDRLLGQNRGVDLPVRVSWVFTSNNLTYSDEIARRVVPIRLEPQTDHPELRTGFRHAPLLDWASEHRAELLWALCIFVRHWQASGCPAPTGKNAVLGSYEGWVRVVGGILESVGYTDFLATRGGLVGSADVLTAAWEGFVQGWFDAHQGRAVGAGLLLPLAVQAGVPVHGKEESAQIVSLAKGLQSKRGRFFGPLQIRKGTGSEKRQWMLWRHPVDGSDGSDGYSASSTYEQNGKCGEGKHPPHPSDPSTLNLEVHESSHQTALLSEAWRRVAEAENRVERQALQEQEAI